MFFEAVVYGGKPASARIEDAARWVHWAVYDAGNESKKDTVRFNLGEFWKAKQKILAPPAVQTGITWALESTATAEEARQLDQLDVIAHGMWSAIESREVYYAGPNVLQWLRGKLGLSVSNEDRERAARAADAAKAGAIGAAKRSGWLEEFARILPGGAELSRDAGEIDSQAGTIAGVPLWVWGLAGVAVMAGLVFGRGR